MIIIVSSGTMHVVWPNLHNRSILLGCVTFAAKLQTDSSYASTVEPLNKGCFGDNINSDVLSFIELYRERDIEQCPL